VLLTLAEPVYGSGTPKEVLRSTVDGFFAAAEECRSNLFDKRFLFEALDLLLPKVEPEVNVDMNPEEGALAVTVAKLGELCWKTSGPPRVFIRSSS